MSRTNGKGEASAELVEPALDPGFGSDLKNGTASVGWVLATRLERESSTSRVRSGRRERVPSCVEDLDDLIARATLARDFLGKAMGCKTEHPVAECPKLSGFIDERLAGESFEELARRHDLPGRRLDQHLTSSRLESAHSWHEKQDHGRLCPNHHHADAAPLSGLSGALAGIGMLIGRTGDDKHAAEVAGLIGSDHVLDIGCGPDAAARYAARCGRRSPASIRRP